MKLLLMLLSRFSTLIQMGEMVLYSLSTYQK